jgi:hypothetical protein
MRTAVIVPDALLAEARAALGFESNTETVIHALSEIVRREHAAELKALFGTIAFEFDPTEMRRRERERLNRT